MVKEFPALPSMSLERLKGDMARGTRLCPEHSFQVHKSNGKRAWQTCILRLPRSMEDLETYEKTAGTFLLARDPAGHKLYLVHSNPEVEEYFSSLQSRAAEPTVTETQVMMAFIRLDLVRFTKLRPDLQPRAMADIHELIVNNMPGSNESGSMFDGTIKLDWAPEGVIHTGDGFVLPVPPSEPDNLHPLPLEYAKRMAQAMDDANRKRYPIHFRMSVTVGSVWRIGDLGGKPNYVGAAINESERLLSSLPSNWDDVVVISYDVYRRYLDRIRERMYEIHRFGGVTDKHGETHRLYLLEYTK